VTLFDGSIGVDIAAVSPGQQARHYSPRTPAVRLSSPIPESLVGARLEIGRQYIEQPPRRIEMPPQPDEYGRHLYAALRVIDSWGAARLYVQMPPDEPQWAAVRDRLLRATRPA
jgi:L-threonylcarbamoyladenylate synthase